MSFISCLSIRSLFVLNKGSQRKNPLICSDHFHHRSEGRIQEDISSVWGQHQWWSTLQRIDCKNWWRLHLAINGPCPRLEKRPCTKFQKMKISLNNGVAVQKIPWELYFDCYCARLQKMVKVIVMCNKPSVWDKSTQAEACGPCSKVCSLWWQFLDFQCFTKHSEHTADPIQKHADYMNSNPILTYSSFVVLLKWLWE